MESTTLKHIINSLSQDNNIRKEAEQYFIQKKNDNIEDKKAHPDGCALKFKYSIHYFFCKKLGI